MTATPRPSPVIFRGVEIEAELAKRGDRPFGQTAKRDLERYYRMVDAVLEGLDMTEQRAIWCLTNSSMVWLRDAFGEADAIAVRDAVDRFIRLPAEMPLHEQLRAAGLVRS